MYIMGNTCFSSCKSAEMNIDQEGEPSKMLNSSWLVPVAGVNRRVRSISAPNSVSHKHNEKANFDVCSLKCRTAARRANARQIFLRSLVFHE